MAFHRLTELVNPGGASEKLGTDMLTAACIKSLTRQKTQKIPELL